MIIAHVADIHLDERKSDSGESLDEQIARLLWIGDDARQHGARLILVAGDVFERSSTPAERSVAIEAMLFWAGVAPVVVVYGNHDKPIDLDVLAKLRTCHPIHVADRPRMVTVADLEVACVPWPRKAWLAGKLAPGEDVSQVARQAMQTILLGFAAQWDPVSPRIVLAHAEVGSASMDCGQPVTGKADIELSGGDLLDTAADYVALGHIHQHQIVGDRICYAGSPRQTTFGQDPIKGYCLVDVVRNGPPKITHRKAPGRELITVDAEWLPGVGLAPIGELPEAVAGNIFRLRYKVEEADRVQAAQAAAELRDQILGLGAHSVRVDPDVTSTYRTRSEEIKEARTVEDRMRALWKTRGEEPARAGQILERLAEIESA